MSRIRRAARTIAIVCAGLAMTAGLVAAPANAVTEIRCQLGISFYNPESDTWIVSIYAYLPTNHFDGVGYVVNGARIELSVWGQDTFSDDFLFSAGTYAGLSSLNVTEDRIEVRAPLPPIFSDSLDEDWADSDEIFARARWVDGDGGTLQTKSNVVRGSF
ncbi:hypothetical protein SAMN05444920_106204 [Nonomuraea solani]|uniref:Uncharacterized protein n=1 Tax=Nonomuraea solani TaxID=1144553 RepID=A0A1H6DSL0_9ACTN|nr:hypothetical protein [Nonomuraea solani]SEG88220.1 hypothetical protein SAMN05444920_106204 [Nonomuraea solani]